MISKHVGKIISVVLAGCILLPLVSCKGDGEGGETNGSGSTEYVAGNPDYETTYYSTRMITLPKEARFLPSFYDGEKVFFIADSVNIDEDNNNICHNSLFVCNLDGEIESEHVLQEDNIFISDACALGNNTFVTVGNCNHQPEYRIYDYEGILLKKTTMVTDEEETWSVCKIDDGFLMSIARKICKCDIDGNIMDEFDLDLTIDGYDVPRLDTVFEQGGELYGALMNQYYRIDFETETLEPVFASEDVGKDFFPEFYALSADYHRGTCGAFLPFERYVTELDMVNRKTEILADTNNMLMCPSSFEIKDSRSDFLHVFDKNLFYIPYLYWKTGITEVALIVPDESVDLAQRTPITIQGAGISSDKIMKSAAYYYNVSQDDYYIILDDIANRYGLTTPEDMNTTRLQLMAQYNNGNVPDMFYGDFFDYDYFGEHDMVIDLRHYLGNDPIYDRMTRDDGKIYQVYAGYTLNGYMGKSVVYGNDVSLTSLPEIPDGQRRFGNAFSTDLVYYFIGSDLCSLYRNGDLTYDSVLLAVRTAIENGDEPDYQYTNYEPPVTADVGAGRSSLFLGEISSPDSYYDMARSFHSDPVFVGYPSINGSIHMITPKCLMAVSTSTEYADVCCDFIKSIMNIDVQRRIGNMGIIPVNNDVLAEIVEFVKDPDGASDEQRMMYSNLVVYDRSNEMEPPRQISMPADLADSYLAQINAADTVQIYDWGLWNITAKEVTTYYTQGKSIEEVAEALYSRYLVYAQENYG